MGSVRSLAHRKRSGVQSERGQAITEYLLLVSVIVSAALLVMRAFNRANVQGLLMKPLQGPFAAAYQYGHPQAKGNDNGQSPEKHPRFDDGGNFRIFLHRAK